MPNRPIDYTRLRPGDILLTTGPTAIATGIRFGEVLEREARDHNIVAGLIEGIEALRDEFIPSHSLMVIDPSAQRGAEMTFPHARHCDLSEYADGNPDAQHVIAAARCPWLTAEHNFDACDLLRSLCIAWWDVEDGKPYGLLNFPAFWGLCGEDKQHLVCSMATTQCLIDSVICEGYVCNFPDWWVVAGEDNRAMTGLVSPFDQFLAFNQLGWMVPYTRESM